MALGEVFCKFGKFLSVPRHAALSVSSDAQQHQLFKEAEMVSRQVKDPHSNVYLANEEIISR